MRVATGSERKGRGCCAWLQVAVATACLLVGCGDSAEPMPGTRAHPIAQRAYLWQRVWTPAVTRSVREHADAFAALDVLAAEIAFAGGPPAVSDARPDWRVLRESRVPVGLVVRIGPCASSWAPNAPETKVVVSVCRRALEGAREHGVEPVELQVDFDAATARLRDYRALLEVIRRRVAPPRLVITTLPSWMTSLDFRNLIDAADAYVLQVHSLEKPTTATTAFTLCDPVRAKRWIARAATFGRPFRIALPTYAYRVGFAASGRFLGLQAEGAARAWPDGAIVRTVTADPGALARLVRDLLAAPPTCGEAVAWFRLPSDDDALTWRWTTLDAVRHGHEAQPHLVLRLTTGVDGTRDVVLANEGSADATPMALDVGWHDARLVATDAVAGWRVECLAGDRLRFQPPGAGAVVPLRPGGSLTIGWVRLDASVPIEETVP